MPALTLYAGNQTMSTSRLAAQAAHHANRRAWAALALVPLALLALAGTAGLAVRHRRRGRQPAAPLGKYAEAAEFSLLVDGRASEPMEGPKPRSSGSSCSQRHRIESMLRSQLSRPGQRIELVPLERLPAALTHQVGSLRRGGRPTAAAATASLPALGSLPYSRLQAVDEGQQHNSWSSFGSGSGGDSNAGLLQEGSSGPSALASRQWGLATDSLRLAPGELELLSGPDGALCLVGEGTSWAVFRGRLAGQEDVAVKVRQLC